MRLGKLIVNEISIEEVLRGLLLRAKMGMSPKFAFGLVVVK